MCNVFIWSHEFDEEPRDESDDTDAVEDNTANEEDRYDESVLSDSWRRDGGSHWTAGGADGTPDGEESSRTEDANRLYEMLRERTKGPDDVDGLRGLATESAVDAFRRIVMGILGTIPADIYEVVVTSDRNGVARLMQSSLSTGYALRNAEFRMTLNETMGATGRTGRGIVPGEGRGGELPDLFAATTEPDYMRGVPRRGRVDARGLSGKVRWWDVERERAQEMGGEDYVARLEAENELLRERLAATQMHDTNSNKLMEFMRRLSPEKIAGLQKNLSADAVDSFKKVVKNVLGELSPSKVQQTYSTSRDYLAQLTFWCLLVGYCIRNVEKRMEMTKMFDETEAFAESSIGDFEL